MNLSPLTAATDTSATAAASPAGSSATAGAFDTILALETLAAAPGLELTGLEEGAVSEDAETDEGEDAEGEDLLGFLASLLSPPLTTRPPGGQAAQGDAAANPEDAVEVVSALPGGGAGRGSSAELAPVRTHEEIQSAPVEKASAVQAAGALLESPPLDTSSDADAGSVTRGAEWATPGPRHAAAAEHHRIATPLRDPRWADDFSTRISLMVRGGESSASVQLTPVDLGPMDVSVTVRDSQATIHFGAAQAETRALIESSLPRLREMLEAQGFQLMDASVSQGFARQAREESAPVSRGAADAEPEATATRAVSVSGLLDLYA